LWEPLKGTPVDLVVTNPPYVASGDKLGPGVAEWEPHLALFAGEDGLEMYRRLAIEAESTWLACEVGEGQSEAVGWIFVNSGWLRYEVRKDYADIDRVCLFGKP
jgi:release factor glutamine methyltransferase